MAYGKRVLVAIHADAIKNKARVDPLIEVPASYGHVTHLMDFKTVYPGD